jgi:RHS repeat-associated protein
MATKGRATTLFGLLSLLASMSLFASICGREIAASSTLDLRYERAIFSRCSEGQGHDFGTREPPAPGGGTALGLTPADFLTAKSRTPLLDNPTRTLLTSRGVSASEVDAIDPPTTSIAEQTAGHKTDSVTRAGVTRSVLYDQNGHDGGQVSDDGRLIYAWDPRGLLQSATQKPLANGDILRRVLYYYDGNHRLVGRRAEAAVAPTLDAQLTTLAWQPETRVDVLAADGLPAEVTFVWDAVSDNLVSVVQVGAPASDPSSGILKQIIHGGLGYDDPIEVTTSTGNGSLTRFYPTYDESGTGSLQTVLNASGQLVSRNIPTDAYGDDHLELDGPAIDSVSLDATRDSQGLVTVEVTLHATEALVASSLATGIRLATVDSNGAVVRTAPASAQPVANDPFAVQISVTPDDWTALTDPSATSSGGLTAAALSIAATGTLRANGWSPDLPFLPAPDWARASRPIFATAALPLEVRESLASLSAALAATPAGQSTTLTLYKVDNLALLARASTAGDTPISTLLAARFQAQPFGDPFTGKNYVRERWYDPERGNWLSPDPMGYRDSSNLYAFGGGDPVNHRDPTGKCWNPLDARCREDMAWTGEEFLKLTFTDQNAYERNSEHIYGGAKGVGRLVGKTVVSIGSLVLDTSPIGAVVDPVGSANRNTERLKAIGSFVAHPYNTIRDAHENAADAIVAQEQAGNWREAGAIAGEIAGGDAAAVIGAGEAALGLARLGTRLVARLSAAEAVPASTRLIGAGDPLGEAASWVKPEEGVFDVVVHGTPEDFQVLHNGEYVSVDQRALASHMGKTGYQGGPVRLISCSTGQCLTSIAQDLANKLGAEVTAPSDTVWLHPNGQLTIGPAWWVNNGIWRIFTPGVH